MKTSNIEYYASTDRQLSVRSFNILKRAKVNTIEDLYNSSLIELYSFCQTNSSDYIKLLKDIIKLSEAILISK